MATALPTGVDQAEVQAIFDDLNARGAQVGAIAAQAVVPGYLVPFVTGLSSTMPVGTDSAEISEIMTRANNHGAGVRDRFVINNTPSYLLPNLGDFYIPMQAETIAWLTGVQARGGAISPTYQNAVNTLVNSLKTAGVFSLLDRLWLFAAENTVQATTDLIGSKVCTPVNSPTFTAGRGFQGNGTTSYIDSGFNWQSPSVGANKFVQNNCSMGVWIDVGPFTGTCILGHENGGYSRMIINATTRSLEVMGSTSGGAYAPASLTGFYHVQRTGASASAAYGAGGVQELTAANASAVLGNRNHFILANNYPTGTPTQFSPARASAAWIGASMTQAQITAFNNALVAFFTQAQLGGIPITFDFTTGVLPAGLSLTRASVGWSFTLPNLIHNQNFAGAVSGSPGILPTSWVTGGSLDNMVRTVTVGSGYIDIRLNHQNPTQTSFYDFEFDGRAAIAAQIGQFWQGSFTAMLLSSTLGNAQPFIMILGFNNAQSSVESNATPIALTTTPQTFTITRMMTNATTVAANHSFRVGYTTGQSYDITVRIFAPPVFTTPYLTQAANNVARLNYDLSGVLQGLLVEPAATQYARTDMVGTVLGVLPSPGVLPVGWGFNIPAGITVTIAAFGTLGNGMSYIDVRYNGTTGDTGNNQYFGGNAGGVLTPAVQNNIFDVSLYLQLIAGTWTNVNSLILQLTQRDGANAGVGNIQGPSFRASIDSVLRRFDFSAQLPAATVASVQPVFLPVWSGSVAIDFTIRIAAPGLILGAVPQSPIVAGAAQVARVADVARVPLSAGLYNITVQRLAGSEVFLGQSPSAGYWTIPPNASPVQKVSAVLTGP